VTGATLAALLLVLLCGCSAPDPPPVTPRDAGSCPNDLPKACPSPQPSYAKDVAPIIEARCTGCHAPNRQEASILLTDYDHVNKVKSEVLTNLYGCRMPPDGEPAPTEEERQAILGWLVCGAPNN
jgi:hypothetical protein